VPVGTAKAIATEMLRTLSAAADGFSLSSSEVWVSPLDVSAPPAV
jgi:hypothetical protein